MWLTVSVLDHKKLELDYSHNGAVGCPYVSSIIRSTRIKFKFLIQNLFVEADCRDNHWLFSVDQLNLTGVRDSVHVEIAPDKYFTVFDKNREVVLEIADCSEDYYAK